MKDTEAPRIFLVKNPQPHFDGYFKAPLGWEYMGKGPGDRGGMLETQWQDGIKLGWWDAEGRKLLGLSVSESDLELGSNEVRSKKKKEKKKKNKKDKEHGGSDAIGDPGAKGDRSQKE